MNTSFNLNVTIKTAIATNTAPSANSMVPFLADSNVLYIWIPFAFFLTAVFAVLIVSFVGHTKRVLRRRRVLLDYIEADVMAGRPRICRMFSANIKTVEGNIIYMDWNHSTSNDVHSLYPPAELRLLDSKDPRCDRCDEDCVASRRSRQCLTIPTFDDVGISRSEQCGLEDAGQRSWFPNSPYGRRNLAFSFDEDLGRTHARPTASPQQHRHNGGSVFDCGHMIKGHGYTSRGNVTYCEERSKRPHCNNVCDSQPLRPHCNNVCDSQPLRPHCNKVCDNQTLSSSEANSVKSSGAKGSEATVNGTQVLFGDCHPSPRPVRDSLWIPGTRPAGACSLCGNTLPAHRENKPMGSGPKTKPIYRRQSACSESSGLDLNLSASDTRRPSWSESQPCNEHKESAVSAVNERSESSPASITILMPDLHTMNSKAAPKRRIAKKRSTVGTPCTNQTARVLDIYTIELNSQNSGDGNSLKRASLPESESTDLGTTNAEPLKRNWSISLPLHRTSPLTTEQHQMIRSQRSKSSAFRKDSGSVISSLSRSAKLGLGTSKTTAATLSPTSAVKASPENSIFWLSGSSDMEQTLV